MVTITTELATPERWDDVVAAFGSRGKDPGWCWCQRFVAQPDQLREPVDNRTALRVEVEGAAVPPGLVAYVDGEPAGWTRVMPRVAVSAVSRNRALRRVLTEDPGAWWVTCFAVAQRFRKVGVAKALLGGAVAHAAANGATAVEGHPVDVAALKATKVSGSALFAGTMATFVEAGFIEVARTYPSRPVMRRTF